MHWMFAHMIFFHLSGAYLLGRASWLATILPIHEGQHLPSQFLFGFASRLGRRTFRQAHTASARSEASWTAALNSGLWARFIAGPSERWSAAPVM
jgi:hypothetical protein